MDDTDALIITKYDKYIKNRIAKSWSNDNEYILKMWAEKASGWAWLHDKSARYYNVLSSKIMYPSIILGTLSGSLGLAFTGYVCNYHIAEYISYGVAGTHLLCSTLFTLNKFMRSSEKAEIHLHMNKEFSAFSRKIVLELTLKPEDRRDALEFCKACRDEYDKLVNDSLIIPIDVVTQFKEKYRDAKFKPEVCNGLIHFASPDSKSELNKDSRIIGLLRDKNSRKIAVKSKSLTSILNNKKSISHLQMLKDDASDNSESRHLALDIKPERPSFDYVRTNSSGAVFNTDKVRSSYDASKKSSIKENPYNISIKEVNTP